MARMTPKTAAPAATTRTPGDPRGAFFDLFDADTAVELTMRGEFSLEQLVKLAARAGLKPQLKLAKAA